MTPKSARGATWYLAASAALWIVAAAPVCADPDSSSLSEDDFIGDLPVVLTATRLAQPASETPAAVTVIDRDTIKASGARQVADLFRLVPGFQVGSASGNQPIVTYHGLSSQYSRSMQVLVDGRSVYSPLFGGVFWYELPLALDDIERIEVIRGPNAAAYGSNSVFGIVNIITRHPLEGGGAGQVSAGADVLDGVVRQHWRGGGARTRMTLGHRADEGFESRPDSSRVSFANVRSEIDIGATDGIELQLGASRARNEDGFYGHATNVPRDTRADSHYQLVRWSRRQAADQELNVQFSHTYRRFDDDYRTEPLDLGPFGIVRVPISFDAVEKRYDVELQHILQPRTDWRVVWGAGARVDQVRSRTRFSTSDMLDNHSQRLFGNVEWRAVGNVSINAGALAEHSDLADTVFAPRLAINYQFTPEHTLRAAISRAPRTPVLLEARGNEQFFYNGLLLEQDFRATSNLRPEIMNTLEAGYLGRWHAGRLQLDVRAYRDRIDDVMTSVVIPAADVDGQAFSLVNDGEVTVDGIDTGIEWRPNDHNRVLLNYAHMRAKAEASDADEESLRAASVPRHTFSVLAAHRFDAWQASVTFTHVDDMAWRGTGDLVDAFSRTDLRLARSFLWQGNRAEWSLTIQNAFDDAHVNFREENVAGRRVFMSLGIDLH